MADLAELHQHLGGLLGLTLATAQLARKAVTLVDQENERELFLLLQQLDGAAVQVERRCQMLVARHAGLRAGRITARSRQMRASIMGCCRENATKRDLFELLREVADRVRVSTAALTVHCASSDDRAVALFLDFLVSIQKGHAAAITQACSRLGRAER